MKKIIAFLMCVILLITPLNINIYAAETDSSVIPEINISSVSFVKPNETCLITISLYDFDKIALSGGMYNIRISLPQALKIESLTKDAETETPYSLTAKNVLIFSGDFHYDGNEEFGALTEYSILCKINEDAIAGKYDIAIQPSTMIVDDSGDKISYNSKNGSLRIAGRDDSIAGDIDDNDLVETADMLILKKSLLDVEAEEELITDTNADGITDVRDMIFMKKYFISTSPTVYLSLNGDDRNSGTNESPVRSFNKALELVSHGGTVNILDKYSVGNTFKWNHHSKTVNLVGGELDISSLSTFLMSDNTIFKNVAITAAKNSVFCTGGYIFSLANGTTLSDSIIFSTAQTPPEAPDTEPDPNPDTDTDSNTNKTGFPIVNEKETLSIMCVTRADLGDIANSEFSKDYSEMTNIDINWKIYSESAISGQKVLALQSGNLPDIMFTGLTDDEMIQYGNSDNFVEITKDLLKEWAPNIYDTYNKYPEAWTNATNSEGKMFILPGLVKDFNYAQHYWFVRTDWLAKVGMKKSDIKTMDDFYKMLVAFRDGDPNGNGQQDEVPLATWSHGGFIMNPWGFNNAISVSKSGKVTNMYTTDNMKNAVTFWAKVYKEDLVSKKEIDNWAGNNAAFMTLINTGKVGCFWYGWPNMDDDLMSKYETLPYPTNKEGNGDFPAQAINVTPFVNKGNILISKNCKNVYAALRWIDYLFTDDGYMLKQYGTVGKAYKKLADGNYEFTGKEASPDAGPKWSLRCRNYLEDSKIVNQTVSPMYMRRYAIDDWCESTLKINGQKFLPTTWKTKDEVNAEKLYTTYWNSVSDSWWSYVKGFKNMGADWTTLINEMKAKGINKYIATLQGYYDRCNQ